MITTGMLQVNRIKIEKEYKYIKIFSMTRDMHRYKEMCPINLIYMGENFQDYS